MVPAPASTAGREMGQCRFCGVAVDASNGLRQGNAQYPSWICRTCRQGERDMVAAAKNRGEEPLWGKQDCAMCCASLPLGHSREI
eukprot:4095550-Alexandrium_andersonii.AAC.1